MSLPDKLPPHANYSTSGRPPVDKSTQKEPLPSSPSNLDANAGALAQSILGSQSAPTASLAQPMGRILPTMRPAETQTPVSEPKRPSAAASFSQEPANYAQQLEGLNFEEFMQASSAAASAIPAPLFPELQAGYGQTGAAAPAGVTALPPFFSQLQAPRVQPSQEQASAAATSAIPAPPPFFSQLQAPRVQPSHGQAGEAAPAGAFATQYNTLDDFFRDLDQKLQKMKEQKTPTFEKDAPEATQHPQALAHTEPLAAADNAGSSEYKNPGIQRRQEVECTIDLPEEVGSRLKRDIPLALAQYRQTSSELNVEESSRLNEQPTGLTTLAENIQGFNVGIAHAQGLRGSMEDAHFVGSLHLGNHDIPAMAIFDGHNGKSTAFWLQNNLKEPFETAFNSQLNGQDASTLSDVQIESAIIIACSSVNRALYDLKQDQGSGSTMTMTLMIGDRLWCVNIGDSRTVIQTPEGTARQMSEDAKASTERFAKSVEELNGILLKNNNKQVISDNVFAYAPDKPVSHLHAKLEFVSVARSFGDFNYPIPARAEVTACKMGDFALLACDGIYDVIGSESAITYIRERLAQGVSPEKVAEELVKIAYARKSGDNLSAMIVLRPTA